MTEERGEAMRRAVRDRYGAIARGERTGCDQESRSGEREVACCTPVAVDADDPSWPKNLRAGYTDDELSSLPEGAELGLGCGNPTALAALSPGEIVLDLGAGGGVDCFLAAKRVGSKGRVIGVDMTPDMVARARRNAGQVGATNVEFRLGEIEHLPVADGSVDVILSNCVVNLSSDKSAVFREAFRVLKPGGRLAISDLVARGEIPAEIRDDLALHSGCIAGAITPEENERRLKESGFVDVQISSRDAKAAAGGCCESDAKAASTTSESCCGGESNADAAARRPDEWVVSASIEARRPE